MQHRMRGHAAIQATLCRHAISDPYNNHIKLQYIHTYNKSLSLCKQAYTHGRRLRGDCGGRSPQSLMGAVYAYVPQYFENTIIYIGYIGSDLTHLSSYISSTYIAEQLWLS